MKKLSRLSVARIALAIAGLTCIIINLAADFEHNWFLIAGFVFIDSAIICNHADILRRQKKKGE